MGLFNKRSEGGMMDAIFCEETDYLIRKWRPKGVELGVSRKENSIRYGSSLRVHPGQAAVFLYQNDGAYDVIIGPKDISVKTDNFPVLASIIGLAYAGGTPFQAEVYFINLERGMEVHFTVPYFRVIPSEPEYKAYDIRVAVQGSVAIELPRTPEYIKYVLESWGTRDTTLEQFEDRFKTLLVQEVKQVVSNAPNDTGIFIMHFNQLIGEIGPYIQKRIQDQMAHRFGVLVNAVNISDIRYNEEGDGYQKLKRLTEDQAQLYNLENEKTVLLSFQIKRETMRTDADVRNETVRRTAEIQMENMEDMARRMREESQFAQHLQSQEAARQTRLGSESNYINAHALDQQTEVLKTGMENMGSMGAMNLGGGDGHMNPAGMMTGMMMGSAVAGQAAQMMNKMGQSMGPAMQAAGQPVQAPPPIPTPQQTVYYLAINGSQSGPYDINALAQMLSACQITRETLAWSAGLPAWQPLKDISSLAGLFAATGAVPPPIPPIPNNQ